MTTIHATEHGRHQGWVADPPQSHIHAVEREMAHRADRVIVCSYYMRGHVADIFDIDEERVTVIPNGVDPNDLRPVADLAGAAGASSPSRTRSWCCWSARLVYEKGFQLALDALPRADRAGRGRPLPGRRQRHPRGRAEGPGRAARAAPDHGTFLGWIGDDVLHSLYRIADLCVVPSIYEPFGLVALEAMASGCPCIVADTGGLREVVPVGERVGLRFNGGDAEHLGVMIERLLVDERAARPAGRGSLRARAALRLGRHRPADAGDLR